MYTLRNQLKISYRAQQKAQIAEKKANNSKKRFISYIFHEVRVPLNTAYLAFQNLQANGNFGSDEDQMVEVYALESSLQQVQQVLNDVLEYVDSFLPRQGQPEYWLCVAIAITITYTHYQPTTNGRR